MNRMTWIIGAAAAALIAQSSNATVLTFSSGDIYSGSFGDSNIPSGSFTDTLTFTVPDGSFGGDVISNAIRIGDATDIDFTSVFLDGPGGPYPFTIMNNDGPTGTVDRASLVTDLGAGTYTLTIEGVSRGSGAFGGSTSYLAAAVPEPASWAMMISGFGLIGGALRTTRRKVAFG